jgi:hypothetical protein
VVPRVVIQRRPQVQVGRRDLRHSPLERTYRRLRVLRLEWRRKRLFLFLRRSLLGLYLPCRVLRRCLPPVRVALFWWIFFSNGVVLLQSCSELLIGLRKIRLRTRVCCCALFVKMLLKKLI